MSDFYGHIMSTSFRVVDRAAFLEDRTVQLAIAYAMTNDGFFEESSDGAWAFAWADQWPSTILFDANEAAPDGEAAEYDLVDAIQRHIVPGDLCHIQVSGNQKLIFIGGATWWITQNGYAFFDGTLSWDERPTRDTELANLRQLLAQMEAL